LSLERQLVLDAGLARQLGDRRGPLQLRSQPGGARVQRGVDLLEPARDADRTDSVAEVPLDLADDAGNRVRREIDPSLEVEPVDGVDQADRADLDEVLERLPAPGMLPRDPPYERLYRDLASAQIVLLAAQRMPATKIAQVVFSRPCSAAVSFPVSAPPGRRLPSLPS
jgi:hypothetical protein